MLKPKTRKWTRAMRLAQSQKVRAFYQQQRVTKHAPEVEDAGKPKREHVRSDSWKLTALMKETHILHQVATLIGQLSPEGKKRLKQALK